MSSVREATEEPFGCAALRPTAAAPRLGARRSSVLLQEHVPGASDTKTNHDTQAAGGAGSGAPFKATHPPARD